MYIYLFLAMSILVTIHSKSNFDQN